MCSVPFPEIWSDLVVAGGNRLVVRQWRGSARWWNLNRNDESPVSLARAEVSAYRIAYKSLPHLALPKVLHFEPSTDDYPWAIFSYVGEESVHFDENRQFTMTWVESMIKVRHEFGFDEPHPRWGRVPVDDAVTYALKVLRAVTIPLHQHLSVDSDQEWRDLIRNGHATTFADMLVVYEDAHALMMTACTNAGPSNKKLLGVTDCIGKCTIHLRAEASNIKPLSSVLVHMDCQPQNMIFHRSENETHVASVLDWEEAAYADPRFELILLGRKVCANRAQANMIWKTYEDECQTLGDIEPWLRLETMHSIITLVLQSMNLAAGGRNPWETQPDLWGKIERELHRLVGLGWEFCTEILS